MAAAANPWRPFRAIISAISPWSRGRGMHAAPGSAPSKKARAPRRRRASASRVRRPGSGARWPRGVSCAGRGRWASGPWRWRHGWCLESPRGGPQTARRGCARLAVRASRTALVTPCGRGRQPARRQATGPRPKPRGMPWPQRLSASVGKSSRRWRSVRVQHRLIVGAAETSEAIRGQRGGKMHTRVVERRQLDLRQPGAATGRRVTTFCQPEAGGRQPVPRFQASHHFVWPQARLRLPVLATTAIQRWRPGFPSGSGV